MFLVGRRSIKAPESHPDHLSRRQAVARLGLRSEFKLRQLEKAGALHPVRGELGSAWYSVAELDAVAAQLGPVEPVVPPPRGRVVSDAALLALLRTPRRGPSDSAPRWRTPADLVVETGISLARAERIHRFFVTWDEHEAALAARGRAEEQRRRELDQRLEARRTEDRVRAERRSQAAHAAHAAHASAERQDEAARAAREAEARRERLEVRQAAFVQLKALARDPDPEVRKKAVEQLSECLRDPSAAG